MMGFAFSLPLLALNLGDRGSLIGIALSFLAYMTRKNGANALLKSVLEAARPIKEKVQFLYYNCSDVKR